MSNKVVSHCNGKITRTDLYDGLIYHHQEQLPTTIPLPDQPGQFVLYTDGNGNFSFEIYEQQEQESVQLIPSQFKNDDNTCCFTKGYPSILVANSANDWTELKLNTGYYQVIRYADGVYDSVTLNSTIVASVIGMNKTNTTTNTLLYVDGATKTDNKVSGISMSMAGYYMLNNNLSNSRVDAMFVNPLNLFNRALGLNSNNTGLLAYNGNSLSKINLPTNTGYYAMYNNGTNTTITEITLQRVVENGLSSTVDFKTQTVIPFIKQGSCRAVIVPDVTATTNCLMTVGSDKSISLVPLNTTNIGQVLFETHDRYANEKSVGNDTVIDIAELFPTFQTKTVGTYEITIHAVMHIEDTSVFDRVSSDNLATITLTSGSNTDTMYLMNPMSNIVNIRLTVQLAVSDNPTLSFNLGKNITGCKILPTYGKCVIKQYSNL